MITEITNNPFRILGLPSNASKKEIDQRYHELIDGLKLQDQHAEVMEEIEMAYHAVTTPEDHWHYALFWFVCISGQDRHALQYVEEENYEDAMRLWEERLNYASMHNLMLCYMLMGESDTPYYDAKPFYAKTFYYARCFFLSERDFELFKDSVGESDKVAADEAKSFLDIVFSQTSANKPTLYALLGNKAWMEYVKGKWVLDDEVDAGVENVQNYIASAEIVREAEIAEESKKSLFNWVWWVILFPIYLFIHHQCQESHKPEPLGSPFEIFKSNQSSHPIIDMTDSATFNRVNTEIKIMKEKDEGEYKSLKERLNEKRQRYKH